MVIFSSFPGKKKGPSLRVKQPAHPTNRKIDPRLTKRHLLVSLLLAFVTFIVFFQVTQNEFTNYDDTVYITNNKNIQEGITLKGVAWAFTTTYANFWHPLTWISHMIDVQLFGLNPGGHHLTNLLLHLTNAILLFLILSRMTKALWQSAFVAALFALHPLHVESVAWAAERKDVLSSFFWILTIGLYATYAAQPSLRRYLVILLCFFLGLMAKPMLVTLPFVLLLLDYWPLGRLVQKDTLQVSTSPSAKKKKEKSASTIPIPPDQTAVSQWMVIRPLLIEKIPFLVLALLFSLIAYFAQGEAVATFKSFPLTVRIANAFMAYLTYIIKMVWPSNLAVSYPHPGSWPAWQVLVSVILFLLFTILAFRVRKTHPYGMVGWFWYAGTLVPVIGIVQVGIHALADRYTYVPLIGLFIILAWGLPEMLKTWSFQKQALIALSVLSLVSLSLLAWRQVGHWRNSLSLYTHTLSVTKANVLIQTNRGQAYFESGMIKEAISDFNKAIEINPRYVLAYNNRGSVYGSLGNFQQAVKDFDKAIELEPGYASAYTNRAFAYSSLGYFRQALKDYDKAIELNSQSVAACHNRGMIHNQLGNYQQAIQDFNKSIELDPKFRSSYYYRGLSYGSLGNHEQAIRDIRVAAQLGEKNAQDFLLKEGLNW